MSEKKTYRIPVIYEMWGIYTVEADSLEEAKKKVMEPGYPLPPNGEYIEDSCKIDEEGISIHNDEE